MRINNTWPFTYSYKERYEKEGIVSKAQMYIDNLKNSNVTIVDVGCSDAQCTAYMKSKLKNCEPYVIGIDIEKIISKEAKRNVDEFVLASAFNLPFKDNMLDIVICQNFTYNFLWRERRVLFSEIDNVVKNSGVIITNTGNYTSINKPKTEMIYSKELKNFTKNSEQNWRKLSFKDKTKIISQICIRRIIIRFVEPVYRRLKHSKKKTGIETLLKPIGNI